VLAAVVVAGVAGRGCGGRSLEGVVPTDAGATLSPPPTDGRAPPQADSGATEPSADAGAVGQSDAAAPSDTAWPLAQTHRLTTESVEAVQLATNGSAVFGLTADSGVWSLAAGDTSVHVLVSPAAPPTARWGSGIAASGSDVYWLDKINGTLHRTHADGSGDDVLADGLNSPDTLAIDDTRVYWSEVSYLGEGGGRIRSLPRDAAPGGAPATLVSVGLMNAISSLAASRGTLYWTAFISIGSTVYYASLFAGSTDTLLSGGSGSSIDGSNPYAVTATGGAVFYGYHRDLWTTVLVDLPSASGPGNLLSILPVNVGLAGLAATDSWLIVTGDSSVGTDLYIAPRHGAGLVRIAQGLRTPAIVGPAGVTFIDASGALVFIKTDDLGYVGYGHPAP
jgi:hypothetical protein